MSGTIRRLKRLIASWVGFEEDEDSAAGSKLLENLSENLTKVRASAVRVIASQYRIERLLAIEKEKLSEVNNELQQASADSSDDLVFTLETRKALCQARIEQLEAQLKPAQQEATQARQLMEQCRKELHDLAEDIRSSLLRYRTSSAKSEAEKSALESLSEKDLIAIERMKERADIAQAEAEARVELRNALGPSEGRSDL